MDIVKRKSEITKKWVKLVFIIFTIFTLLFSIGSGASADSKLTTVYYVYMNDEFIGTVSNKEIIEKVLEEKLKEAKGTYEQNYDYTVGSNLTYIPEQVFSDSINLDDEEVVKKLEDNLQVEVQAAAFMIDGKEAVYLKNKEAAEQVIEKLKSKFVSKDDLAQLEKKKDDFSQELPDLKKGESRILDVSLSKDVSIVEKEVSPKEILSVDQAVDYLLKGTLNEKKYKVKDGDVLGQIAEDHGMKLKELLSLNPNLKEDSVLKIGQEINVTYLKPLIEVNVEKEVNKEETVKHKKIVKESSSMYKGDKKVKQKGKDGKKEVIYKVTEKNGENVKKEVVEEKVIKESVDEIVLKGTKVIPSRGTGSFAWPAVGGYISSKQGYRWGKFHKGIDIARPSDRTIKAADNGKVVSAGYTNDGYGKKVVIDHQNGYQTVYAHLNSISVKVGQTVSKGQKVGVMGSTGHATGVHLHFEVYKNGSLKNPLDYLR